MWVWPRSVSFLNQIHVFARALTFWDGPDGQASDVVPHLLPVDVHQVASGVQLKVHQLAAGEANHNLRGEKACQCRMRPQVTRNVRGGKQKIGGETLWLFVLCARSFEGQLRSLIREKKKRSNRSLIQIQEDRSLSFSKKMATCRELTADWTMVFFPGVRHSWMRLSSRM